MPDTSPTIPDASGSYHRAATSRGSRLPCPFRGSMPPSTAFLQDPGKPALLALARPVARKNLAALLRAYGESPALQSRANLVLMAGTREDIDALDGDMAATLREILVLIDRYDLYGRVAYPKTHDPEDVPAIYAYARVRGGLFVNPALNEPFGLTLLEASASGLSAGRHR